MANKLNFTPESLLNNKFTANVKGYDPLEVDETLDKVIKDYETYENLIKNANNQNAKHLQDIDSLKKQIAEAEIELAKLRKQLDAIPVGELNQDNYTLMKKASAYERFLWKKGIDPNKVYSDPDNC